MDNVVLNISMEDIVSSKYQPNKEEETKIIELAQLIKTFGILDPLLVRPRNGKYEIIMGHDRYQAARIAGLSTVPALIKEIDDEAFSKYLNLDNQSLEEQKLTKNEKISNNNPTISLEKSNSSEFLKPLPNYMKLGKSTDSDIVNLSDLNQKEYERNDIKMNNEQLNTNMINNNFNQPIQPQVNQPSQEPTFGGKFFPSLEDEPTNMNMLGANINQPIMATPTSVPNVGERNNLIDLTDLSLDKEPTIGTPNVSTQPITPPSPEPSPQNLQMPSSNFEFPSPSEMNTSPTTDNIVSLENLQSNINSTPAPTPTITNDFATQTPIQEPTPVTQFDMSQNVAPQSQIPSVPNLEQLNNIQQNDFSVPQDQSMTREISEVNIPNNTQSTAFPTMNSDFSQTTPIPSPEAVSMPSTGKDVTPVTNIIKNLVSSLEAFGYKLNIQEENLPTSAKITIEVEK